MSGRGDGGVVVVAVGVVVEETDRVDHQRSGMKVGAVGTVKRTWHVREFADSLLHRCALLDAGNQRAHKGRNLLHQTALESFGGGGVVASEWRAD